MVLCRPDLCRWGNEMADRFGLERLTEPEIADVEAYTGL